LGASVTSTRAVLFDWRGTLAHSPPPRWWAGRALAAIGRPATAGSLPAIEAALVEAGSLTAIDASADVHRHATLGVFARHGLDPELAGALYALDADPANHPLYPDAEAALRAVRAHGAAVAVVSDFHVDLRPMLAAAELVDAWVISYEHGVQKPDPRIFTLALDALGVEPGDALMVGDRASHDGGAVDAGIATLILPPPPPELAPRGLDLVLRLLDQPPSAAEHRPHPRQ
jgi:HAD superfamily hydrolase (TIGR01509 family)